MLRGIHRLNVGAPRRWSRYMMGEVTLGGVTTQIWKPGNPQLVPVSGYLPDDSGILAQVRWMMQKHNLGQDIYLLGPPGPRRRWLALKFCHALMREVEYLSLSRDTTEADIKQRREMQNGNLVFVDQPAVRAAIHGRVLILDGVERVERNVLPIINNLLENREMSLEDGRFLTSPDRWDELLQTHTEEELKGMGLVKVSREFRVLALGLPVPRYQGTPLDPPLRSRFQCLGLEQPSLGSMLASVRAKAPRMSTEDAETMVGFLAGLASAESGGTDQDQTQHFPDLLEEDLLLWASLKDAFPNDSLVTCLQRVFPYSIMTDFKNDDNHSRDFFTDVLHRYSLNDPYYSSSKPVTPQNTYTVKSISEGEGDIRHAVMTFGTPGGEVTHTCGCGETPGKYWHEYNVVRTESFSSVLTDMYKDHCLGRHLCLVGPPGCGKSALAKSFAYSLGYGLNMSTVHCHWDMSARDVLQRRMTEENGDTTWEAGALTNAAIEGRLVILDGVDKLQPGVLASLGRLFIDGEATLYDGTVLRRSVDYQRLLDEGMTREDLTAKKVFEVHPAFRIIALAQTPKEKTEDSWVEGEVQHFFSWHRVHTPLVGELEVIFKGVDPTSEVVPHLLMLHKKLRQEHEADATMPEMSLRQLLRIVKGCKNAPQELHTVVSDTLLVDIMPQFAAERVTAILKSLNIYPSETSKANVAVKKTPTELSIGEASCTLIPLTDAEEAALVPSIVFHDNFEHLVSLKKMLVDIKGSDNILLIGKQGVGKNRLVDRLLQLLERPRQYVQLHRDSTVASLTVRPEVIEGRIVWEDAPLVTAVKKGHILVVDEIDKAPLEVVGILKGLIEDKELLLSDGRRIVEKTSEYGWTEADGAIPIHPNFRLIALANVPGFPFLGNDFFASCGDLFRCHLIDNPTRASKLEVLQQYGPNVPAFAMHSMVDAFEQLDNYVSEGLLAYPYSLRELVAVVKHIQKYPDDGLVRSLRNVFDFDAFDIETVDLVNSTFEAHGIPLSGKVKAMQKNGLAKAIHLTAPEVITRLELSEADVTVRVASIKVSTRLWEWAHSPSTDASIIEGRGDAVFDERLYTIVTPGNVKGVVSTLNGQLHALVELNDSVPSVMSWKGKNLYAPVFSRPCSLDHGSCKILELGTFAQNNGGVVDCSLYAFGNEVVLFSPNAPSLFVIDPERRMGYNHSAPLLKQVERTSWQPFRSSKPDVRIDPTSMTHGVIVLWNATELNVYHGATKAWAQVTFEGNDMGDILDVRTVSKTEVMVLSDTGLFLADVQSAKVQKVRGEADGDWNTRIPQRALYPGAFTPSNTQYIVGDITNNNATGRKVPEGLPLSFSSTHLFTGIRGNIVARRSDKDQLLLVDTAEATLRILPVRDLGNVTPYGVVTPPSLAMLSNGCVVATTPSQRQIAVYDSNVQRLQGEWSRWASIVGGKGKGGGDGGAEEELEFKYSNSDIQPSELKHGKEDPDNTPHVGGNTWAGGTGGTDTAGLGGKVGPYRIDAGHPVHQVSDEAKAAVPEHLKKQAREMGRDALKKRLNEIRMSEGESSMYNRAHDAVRREVAMLQTMLKGLRSTEGERVWLKNQTDGVWDENKLVEGMTGEKGVFKKRGESQDQPSLLQGKKKRIVFCMDCSASMFRFNSMDHRLDRIVETAIMITEAFKGVEDKIEYCMIGHSGDSPEIPLVDFGKPPQNKKERLEVVLSMVAHTQYCWSGDNTLESMQVAIKKAVEKEGDSHFVFVISDANLRRYGIAPQTIANIMRSDPKVQVFCIFIASLGQEAENIKRTLPAGKGHVCYNSNDLPSVLKRIFLSTNLLK
eukprot:TRINITY_DN1366_c0_g3_i1.p1 TRINITY_DN1366_c0_g3~~TRINITY_DN1366_c0_g3_i1.p1  ORF type:complete len:1824 (+),score=656.81 TRINITY_DN1366_c0_g3_i1:37-5472(+)